MKLASSRFQIRCGGRAQRAFLTLLAAAVAAALLASGSEAAVITYANGPARNGVYPTMHRLSPGTVAGRSFGKLFDRGLPDHAQVYGQPLIVHGRLVVVTENNDVYELDPRSGHILRSRSLGPPWTPTLPTGSSRFTCHDLYPDVGITSTPVIDTSADHGRGVIYLTSKTPVPPSQAQVFNQANYLMYALRLQDLSNLPSFSAGRPLTMSGISLPNNPSFVFNPTFELQRPALLELGGQIFAGFGGICDTSPYAGWVIGVRAADGTLASRWATPTAPGARGAGIWMAGAGLASDGPGRIFLATGNGFNAPNFNAPHTPSTPTPGSRPPSGLASSVVRLQVGAAGGLSAADFFTPCDARTLDGSPNLDLDVSAGGVVALPPGFGTRGHRDLLLAGGKSGTVYALDRHALGGFAQGRRTQRCRSGGDAAVQMLGPGGSIWGETAVWPRDGGWLFVPTESPSASNDPTVGRMEFIHQRGGSLHRAGVTPAVWGQGSGSPVVSSIGWRSDTALVWAVGRGAGPPRLRVFRAVPAPGTPAGEQIASFPVGAVAKFAAPGVGNDEVFVAGAGHVIGFGVRTPR